MRGVDHLTIVTGHGQLCSAYCDADPMKKPVRPDRPREPMNTMAMLWRSTKSTIAVRGSPTSTSASKLSPSTARARSSAACRCWVASSLRSAMIFSAASGE